MADVAIDDCFHTENQDGYTQNFRVSVVITTRNRFHDLVECIESLVVAMEGIDPWELLVINDNSSDETESIDLATFGVKYGRAINNERQLMLVKSRNIGGRNARGEYVLFVDDDNIVQPDMVRRLVSFAQQNREFGMIGPVMMYLDPPTVVHNHQKVNFFTGRTRGFVDCTDRKFVDSHGVPNIFLIPKKVFQECGYFDERLIQTYTEPDFAFQIWNKGGYRCCIIKEARTIHKIYKADNWTPRGLGGNFMQKGYCLLRNRSVIVRRYGRWYHKFIYLLVFSWIWPFAYSAIILSYKQPRLIGYYFQGWLDGLIYFFTGNLMNNFRTDGEK